MRLVIALVAAVTGRAVLAERDGAVEVLLPAVYDVLWTVVALGVPLAVVVWLAVRALRSGPPAPSRAAEAARRHAGRVHAAAWVAALAALLVLGYGLVPGVHDAAAGLAGAYGRLVGGRSSLGGGLLVGMVPAAAGLAYLAVHAVGELTWPRPTGTVRRAALVRRTVGDVSPRRQRVAAWTWSALLAVTLVACGLAADADGRGVSRTGDWGSATQTPFPGWFYGVPLLVGALLVLIATEVVLRLVARRPAVMDAAPTWDLALRRLSAHRVLRGAQLVLGATAGAVLVVAGTGLRGVGTGTVVDGVARDSTVHEVGGAALTLLGVAVLLLALGLAALAGRPAGEPDPPVGPGAVGLTGAQALGGPAPATPTPGGGTGRGRDGAATSTSRAPVGRRPADGAP